MKPAVTDPPEVQTQLWQGFVGDVGWDIGANCGQTLPEMNARFRTVYAFEPAEECWPYLQELALMANTMVLPIALSDTDQTVDLIALPDKIDTGQLVSAGIPDMEWNPDDPAATVRAVTCRTVDSLIDDCCALAPDFMKIDVEGHELKVLYGAKRTLAVSRPDLLIEFHSQQLHRSCVDLLSGFGYTCFTIRHPHYYPGTPLWLAHGWLRARQ